MGANGVEDLSVFDKSLVVLSSVKKEGDVSEAGKRKAFLTRLCPHSLMFKSNSFLVLLLS